MRRAIAAVGRTLVTAGLLILLFVAYQLWGTGIYTAQAQDDLRAEFDAALADPTVGSSTTSTTDGRVPVATTTTVPAPPLPPEGEPVARITIDSIGVDWIVVNGVSKEDLKKGPGLYPFSPLPGQAGNVAIAGHRTTYGQPFFDLDRLVPGDVIRLRTVQGEFRYLVTEQLVVTPEQTEVVAPTAEPMLTLTTCHPKFSARQRLVVKARLDVPPEVTPPPATPVQPDAELAIDTDTAGVDGGELLGETVSWGPVLAWGGVVALVGGVWWWAFRRWRLWPTWALGALPFAAVLFAFYASVERIIPSGY